MKEKKTNFPQFKSPDGEIYTCIFFATKTPPGIEWYGFKIHSSNLSDTVYYGLVDFFGREFAYFSLNDIINSNADYTSDPDVIRNLTLPPGWVKHDPVMISEYEVD